MNPGEWSSGCGRYRLVPVGRIGMDLFADVVVDGTVVGSRVRWDLAKASIDAIRAGADEAAVSTVVAA